MMDIKQILKILPHRYPFLLVDRVISVDENQIRAVKQVTINEPFFSGHFPGHPIMPGVLQIEALAQVGGLLANYCGAFEPKRQLLIFMGIKEAKFRQPVEPGHTLELEVLPLKKGRVWRLAGKGYVNGKIAVQAELSATIVARAKDNEVGE